MTKRILAGARAAGRGLRSFSWAASAWITCGALCAAPAARPTIEVRPFELNVRLYADKVGAELDEFCRSLTRMAIEKLGASCPFFEFTGGDAPFQLGLSLSTPLGHADARQATTVRFALRCRATPTDPTLRSARVKDWPADEGTFRSWVFRGVDHYADPIRSESGDRLSRFEIEIGTSLGAQLESDTLNPLIQDVFRDIPVCREGVVDVDATGGIVTLPLTCEPFRFSENGCRFSVGLLVTTPNVDSYEMSVDADSEGFVRSGARDGHLRARLRFVDPSQPLGLAGRKVDFTQACVRSFQKATRCRDASRPSEQNFN